MHSFDAVCVFVGYLFVSTVVVLAAAFVMYVMIHVITFMLADTYNVYNEYRNFMKNRRGKNENL